MGRTVFRVVGFVLAFSVLLIGIGVTVLLYYAGQGAIDVFFTHNTYRDGYRIRRLLPMDTWYGAFMLRGWGFGFIFLFPGITGIAASLFYNKVAMVIHFIFSIVLLFVGSFLYTGGTMALVAYRLLVLEGAVKYDPWLGDCIYIREYPSVPLEYVDEQCLAGRRTLHLTIAALSVMCLVWILILADVLYCAFTYSNIKKTEKKIENQPNYSDTTRLISSQPQNGAQLDPGTSDITQRQRGPDYNSTNSHTTSSLQKRSSPRTAGTHASPHHRSTKVVSAPKAPYRKYEMPDDSDSLKFPDRQPGTSLGADAYDTIQGRNASNTSSQHNPTKTSGSHVPLSRSDNEDRFPRTEMKPSESEVSRDDHAELHLAVAAQAKTADLEMVPIVEKSSTTGEKDEQDDGDNPGSSGEVALDEREELNVAVTSPAEIGDMVWIVDKSSTNGAENEFNPTYEYRM